MPHYYSGVAYVDPDEDYYCDECDRSFTSMSNFQQHLRSRVHLDSDIHCPFCKRDFTTATGVIHHLERGSCPRAPQLNREMIFRIMKERDPNGYVTNLLLKYEQTTYTNTNKCWNGRAFECYFCNREFRTKYSLDQHLNSPVRRSHLKLGEVVGGLCGNVPGTVDLVPLC